MAARRLGIFSDGGSSVTIRFMGATSSRMLLYGCREALRSSFCSC